MAKIPINLSGGGGVFSDDITAAKADVVAGKKAVTSDSNDEVVEGTLADKSGTAQSATASLDATNSRLQMTIPATGKYSTASKIYAAYSAIRSLIGLTADKIWYNETILGLKSGRSGIAAKTYTPGTANQVIAAGTCNVGAQTIKGDANLVAANIKKGVKIFGVTGTWEGYVAGTTEFYDNGANNGLQAHSYVSFESGAIYVTNAWGSFALSLIDAFNFTPYTKFNIQFKATSAKQTYITFYLYEPGSDGTISSAEGYIGDIAINKNIGTVQTASLDITDLNKTVRIGIRTQSVSGINSGTVGEWSGQIYKIWVS